MDRSDQWNRTESLEIVPCIHENVAYGKGDKSVGKNALFNKWCWNNQAAIWKNKVVSISHFLYQDKFQMDQKFKCKNHVVKITCALLSAFIYFFIYCSFCRINNKASIVSGVTFSFHRRIISVKGDLLGLTLSQDQALCQTLKKTN